MPSIHYSRAMPTCLTEDRVIETVKNARTRVDLSHLTPDADLRAIGADSLDMMTILLDVQGAAGIEIPDSDIGELQSVRAIVNYVNAKVAASG
jgi:acyl carrier protein